MLVERRIGGRETGKNGGRGSGIGECSFMGGGRNDKNVMAPVACMVIRTLINWRVFGLFWMNFGDVGRGGERRDGRRRAGKGRGGEGRRDGTTIMVVAGEGRGGEEGWEGQGKGGEGAGQGRGGEGYATRRRR